MPDLENARRWASRHRHEGPVREVAALLHALVNGSDPDFNGITATRERLDELEDAGEELEEFAEDELCAMAREIVQIVHKHGSGGNA